MLSSENEQARDHCEGRAEDNRRAPLTRIAIETEAVAAAKCQEKSTVPAVRQTETHFNRALGVFRSTKRCTNTVERRSSGIMERLHAKGFISDPKSKAKSVVLSEEGEKRSRELFAKHFALER